MNTTRVSIVIPIYNGEKFIKKCLDSILEQSFRDFEIIVVNDGSTDKSMEILEAYRTSDQRIKLIHIENQGVSNARNVGISQAEGDYILFVDADDWLGMDALDNLVQGIEMTGADLVIGDFVKIIGSKTVPSEHRNYFSGSTHFGPKKLTQYLRTYFMKPNRFPLFVYSWGRLFKTDIIKKHNLKFDTNLKTYEDVKFNFQYMTHVDSIFYLDKLVYHHLVHEDFSSASLIAKNPSDIFGYLAAMKQAVEYDSARLLTKEIANAYITYSIIQFVRLAGQIKYFNLVTVYPFTRQLITSEVIQGNLGYYHPTGGDSRIVPFLMKHKLVLLMLFVCRYKANKRYRVQKKRSDLGADHQTKSEIIYG